MLNQNNLGCFVGIWRFVMSQTICFVAFKWPGVLSTGFTVTQPPIIGFGSRDLCFLEYLQASGDIFDRSGKAADSKKPHFCDYQQHDLPGLEGKRRGCAVSS